MWKSIYTEPNQSIKEKIQSIATEIKKHNIDPNNIGLLGGNSGLLLFLFYFAKYSNKVEYEELGYEIIDSIFDSLNNKAPQTPFSGGLAGIGWTINHLVDNGFFEADTNEIFSDVDVVLYKTMIENIKNKEYDYLHGALGFGMYFLSRPLTDEIKSYLTHVIDELENIGIKEGSDKIKWVYPFELNENNKKIYNLGLSHGIASIIAFLSKVYEKGIHQNKSKELLTKSVNYLLGQELDTNQFTSHFPSVIEPGINPNSSRLAWCYGDMGITIALWQAGKKFQNKLWKERAIEVLVHNSKRKNPEDTLINDAGLCHGSIGVAHIFNRMYNYTESKELKEAAKFWTEKTIEMATFPDGLAGFKKYSPTDEPKYVNSYGFLEGIAGIGLSLMATISEIEPNWDECLLLS